jgi:hypothetical protein
MFIRVAVVSVLYANMGTSGISVLYCHFFVQRSTFAQKETPLF